MNTKIDKVIGSFKKNQPEILIGMGVVGMITSTVMAVNATPKAIQLIEDKKDEMDVTRLTKKETVKAAWKPYIPAATLGAISTACIVTGTMGNRKRASAMAAVYAISENSLRKYQDKVVEICGEEKAKEIETSIVKDRIKEKPVLVEHENTDLVTYTGNGNVLMFDTLSGRYFRSSTNAIERAVNNLNKHMMSEHYVTLNELYIELDMPTIDIGNMVGWDVEKDMVDVDYDTEVDVDGTPYVIINHRNKPRPLYTPYY